MLLSHSVGRQLVRAATASATTAFEFSLLLQGNASIAFAIAKAKSKHQQRSIGSLESKLAATEATLSETQESLSSTEQQATAYKQRLQELEAQVKDLQDAMQDQLSRQAFLEAASTKQQQHLQAEVTTLTTQLAQQTSKAQIYEAQYLQQDSNLRALHSQCFLVAAQLQHSQEQRQHLQAAVAEIQAEASAQATAAQQITQELESQLLQQSAAAEDYVIRSQAELNRLQAQIQQLQLQQYGWVASMEALGSKLVCTSASRSRLLGAAMVVVHTSDAMPNNVRQVLQEAVSAEEPTLLAVAAPTAVRITPQAEALKSSSQESPMPQPATPPRSRETSLPGTFPSSRPSRTRPLTLTLDETEAVAPSTDSTHSSPTGGVPPSSPCEANLDLQAASSDDAQKYPPFVSPFEGHESLSEELPGLVDLPDPNWAQHPSWATWASSDPDDNANGYGPSTSGRKLLSDGDDNEPVASTSGRKLSSSDSDGTSEAGDEATTSTPRRMHRAPSVEQPMPSTSGRSSSPQRRVLMQARRIQVQAAAAYAKSKKRNAALRASANSSCSTVVVHVKQQRCQPVQRQYSFRR